MTQAGHAHRSASPLLALARCRILILTRGGAQALLHPDVCEAVHADYFGLGAEVVITNTYASNRMILEAAGYGDETGQTNTVACERAIAARASSGTDDSLVVGSISCHQP